MRLQAVTTAAAGNAVGTRRRRRWRWRRNTVVAAAVAVAAAAAVAAVVAAVVITNRCDKPQQLSAMKCEIATLSPVGIVIAIFALIGFLYSTKGTPAHAVRSVEDPSGHPQSLIEFSRSLELTHRDDFRPVIDGASLRRRRHLSAPVADLRRARHSIIVQLYYYKPGATTDSLKHILMERAHAGVPYSCCSMRSARPAFRRNTSTVCASRRTLCRFSTRALVHVHKTQNRAHPHAIIIDERIAYTGGFGIADVRLGNGHTPINGAKPMCAPQVPPSLRRRPHSRSRGSKRPRPVDRRHGVRSQ